MRRLEREIWHMAWPVMGSLLITNIVDLVDVAMVGRLGRESVAALGYASQYGQLVRAALLAIGVAAVALIARAVGGNDRAAARRSLAGSLIVSMTAALLAAILVFTFPRRLLLLLDAEPHVADLAVPYFRLVIGSMLLVSASVVLDSAQRAHRNMRTSLLIAGVAAVVKIGLNTVLIFGTFGAPRLGIVGAGVASIAAESVALSLYVVAGRIGAAEGRTLLPSWADLRPALSAGREVLGVSLPAIGERLVMSLALLVYFSILSRYGTGAIAAYAIGVRLLAFSWLPGQGFGAAAATLVGQALGADEVEQARRAGWRSMRLSLYVMAVLGVACLMLREPLAHIFTHDAAIIGPLVPFLWMLAVAQPFMGIHFTLSGALRGSGDTMTPLLGASIGNWALRVPLAWTAARVLGWSVSWVWAALIVDHVARCTWYVLSFRSGRWAHKLRRTPIVAS